MTFTFATAVWLVLLVGFAVLEGVTVALVSVWFAVGAAAAMVVSAFGVSSLWQIAVFLIVSGVCMLVLDVYKRQTWGLPRPPRAR